MRWFNAPRSLFYQLLLFWPAAGGVGRHLDLHPLFQRHERRHPGLRSHAAGVGAHRGGAAGGARRQTGGRCAYVVLDSFERNMNDQLYYEVISPQGKSISGYDDLPPLPPHIPRSTLYPGAGAFLRCGIPRPGDPRGGAVSTDQRVGRERHGDHSGGGNPGVSPLPGATDDDRGAVEPGHGGGVNPDSGVRAARGC